MYVCTFPLKAIRSSDRGVETGVGGAVGALPSSFAESSVFRLSCLSFSPTLMRRPLHFESHFEAPEWKRGLSYRGCIHTWCFSQQTLCTRCSLLSLCMCSRWSDSSLIINWYPSLALARLRTVSYITMVRVFYQQTIMYNQSLSKILITAMLPLRETEFHRLTFLSRN